MPALLLAVSTGKEKEQLRRNAPRMPKEKLQETLVFTYKSDLLGAEAPFEIFADCLETGKSNT